MPLDPRLSFDEVLEIYDRSRPEYPDAAFVDLFAYLREGGSSARPRVLEIGPGTGQATRALLAHGAEVTAVEIGARLAAFLRAKFDGEPRLDVIHAPFEEAAALPRSSFDMVFAATSWHWLDPAVRAHKAVELLVAHGTLATLSTVQIRSDADRGYFERTFEVYRRYRPDEVHNTAPAEGEVEPLEAEEFRASGLLADVDVHRYRWDQRYSTGQYEALVRSYSNTQTMEPGAREALIADLRRIIEQEYDGYVVRPLVIALTMGRKP
jgi:SAM-dependent methyltransferase